MTLSTSCIFCSVTHCLWITTDWVMCIYNESIYSILNLKDVDSTLINPMWFCVVYLNRCRKQPSLTNNYTNEIIKIATMSVKPIPKRCSTCSKRCSTCLKRQPNPSLIIYGLTVWQFGCMVCVLKYLRVAFKFIMSSYCQWSSSVVSYIGQVL